jgi:hypothetical protein
MMDDALVAVPRVVDVTFRMYGVEHGNGLTVERYRLGRADDMLCWALNEKMTAALQISVAEVDVINVSAGLARHIHRSRDGMRPWIKSQLSKYRAKTTRSEVAS